MMSYLLQLDGDILLFIQQYLRHDWMTPFWKFITSLGNAGWFWIVLSIVLLLFKRTRKIGITAIIALAIGALITNVALKNLVARIRPYEVVDGLRLLIERQRDYSFPSGHTCASFAAALVYYKMAPRKWGIPAVILASLIAFSRLYVGVHYPSDVLAGLLIGIFAAWAALKLSGYISQKRTAGTEECGKEGKEG
ncbi:phosphatase PAP2 family protein [Faecalicatena orotica]|jgi:membrane-associated phospholipid phosphatase|uniref:Undecaprenyl-diphosphatase n=2 Tax=Faecalicatena orotica TaxID=1544 RepID=A0A2Y9C9J2_9FIRM|nr:phosphatase PAP2 family protein [Faecalicatena orotica]PWJ32179.1 undecaprenyl-diphosphatase [Faecalicatena orotica]SSA54012.1 undecaprenyl-diphosphatase [Faecalicatena orotica]